MFSVLLYLDYDKDYEKYLILGHLLYSQADTIVTLTGCGIKSSLENTNIIIPGLLVDSPPDWRAERAEFPPTNLAAMPGKSITGQSSSQVLHVRFKSAKMRNIL